MEWFGTPKSFKKNNGLKQVLFNTGAGDWTARERGTASLSGKEQEFRDRIFLALEYAVALQCPRLHIMADLRDETMFHSAQLDIYHQNLVFAAKECAKPEVVALIESINATDMPGFFLENVTMAASTLKFIDHPNLKIQFDMYHVQRTVGDICQQYLANAEKLAIFRLPTHRSDMSQAMEK